MEDMEIARLVLENGNFSFVAVKDHRIIFKGNADGIVDFLIAIKELGKDLDGSSIADRVVGKAAAMLAIRSGIREVYGKVMSRYAIASLKQHEIPFFCEKTTDVILNRARTAICPFENMAINSTDPEDAYEKFKSFLQMD